MEINDTTLAIIDRLSKEIKDEHGKTNATGIKKCPICGCTLYYRVVAYNGHVAAACQTDNCIQWME